ncbi:MAG: type II toxin-antitoxin system RelE/ParE family toxin [Deltaproteobacteria bacterium]|nr:type II toxin-antitoxin system RelE/ParE family toxin [Deltaproteobacteria bacterium]
MYKLVIKNSAKKELDAIPADQFLKIDAAILALKTNPHPHPQSKKLKGEDKRRLRVGDYRVVYAVNGKEKVITIYRVRHRKEVYR